MRYGLIASVIADRKSGMRREEKARAVKAAEKEERREERANNVYKLSMVVILGFIIFGGYMAINGWLFCVLWSM